MARTPSVKPTQPARLTAQEMKAGIARLEKVLADVQRFDPRTVVDQYNAPELDALEASIDDALVRTFGADTLDYRRYEPAKTFDRGPYNYAYTVPPTEFQKTIARSKDSSIALLGAAIKSLRERLSEIADSPVEETSTGPLESPSRKVFVVHGHDQGAREAMARFLEKIGLEAIILQEQADQGFTIIEKFETYANQVSFAVVLLTPDDIAGLASAPAQAARARQNVIFELGYFVAKLGRGRACLLRKGDVEVPSDLYGVIYTDMDAGDGWKIKLVKELKAAKLEFDGNKMYE